MNVTKNARSESNEARPKLSSRDSVMVKPFLLFVLWAGLFYALYTADIYVAATSIGAVIVTWAFVVDEPQQYSRPITMAHEPLEEALIVLLMFTYWILFISGRVWPLGWVPVVLCSVLFGFVLPIVFLRSRGNRLDSVGMRLAGKEHGGLTISICALLIIGGVVRVIAGESAPIDSELWSTVLSEILLLAVVTGFIEEFVFRGVLQNRLSLVLRSRVGGLLSTSIVFAALHMFVATTEVSHGGAIVALVYALVTRLPIGVILGVIWNQSDSIQNPWIVHTINNTVLIFVGHLIL